MLPAISADLPAYLTPTSRKESGQLTTADADSTPAARVELSADRALQANSSQPGKGLYGPDGRFVETANRRAESEPRQREREEADQVSPRAQDSDVVDTRKLTLAEFDAVVPPAAKEELKALADRVGQQGTTATLTARDYKQVADLMDRLGRYDKANEALEKARELEEGVAESESESETESESNSETDQ
ncbi:MAG: hypothetical protein MI923_13195 [Phycisphaerales bacterium]|nr:hypothetical protein [Phycisphaerales bacterium]